MCSSPYSYINIPLYTQKIREIDDVSTGVAKVTAITLKS